MCESMRSVCSLYNQGRIDPSAGRGHATPVQPVQRAKCWRLLNLEPRFEWYHVRALHNTLIYRPYKETANVFLLTASISPSVLAVWELHALSPPLAGRYALDTIYASTGQATTWPWAFLLGLPQKVRGKGYGITP